MAAAALLLCGAGLLLRTLLTVDGIDRGYRARQVLTMMVDPLGRSIRRGNRYAGSRRHRAAGEGAARRQGGRVDERASAGALLFESFSVDIAGEILPKPAGSRPPSTRSSVPGTSGRSTSRSRRAALSPIKTPSTRGPSASSTRRSSAPLPGPASNRRAGCRAAGAHGTRNRARDRRRRPPGEGTARRAGGLGADLRPKAQDPLDDVFLLVRPAAGRADAWRRRCARRLPRRSRRSWSASGTS